MENSLKKAKNKNENTDKNLTEEEKKLREEQRKRAAKKKRKKRIKALIIILVIALVLGFVFLQFLKMRQQQKAADNLTTYTVERRTITEKLSATGTLKPADSYTVTSKVKGDILVAAFEEGDEVQKDDVLYVIDSGDMDSTIRQRAISLENAQESLDELLESRKELTEYSDLSGMVQKVYVEVGDNVQKGSVIADIVDKDTMLIDIPFHASHADTIGKGAFVNLTIEGTGETVVGTVTEIATITGTNPFGAPTKDVTIKVTNPGGITKDTKATAVFGDDMAGTDVGSFYYNVEKQLKAEYSGKIKELYIDEGDSIYEGQKIILFDEEDLEKQIKNAQRSLETAQMNYDDTVENLGDYNIKAPITGTVVEKGFNAGESIDTTGGNATVAIIYDLSALTFDMNIDELDIFSIAKGQEVTVTSDAFEDVFYGEITKISKVGSTSSGTTVYPVTVTITDSAALEKLLPGMNIDAEIIVNRVQNVLAVPTGAIARGNTVKVVKNIEAVSKTTQGNSGNQAEKPFGDNGEPADAGGKSDIFPDGSFPDFEKGEIPANITLPAGAQMPDGEKEQSRGEIQMPAVYGSVPSDTEYETVKVQTGVSDDDFIEIISGLSEGDVVIIEESRVSTGFGMMGMMGMGAMGGGMPSGGMPSGGMPSGGMPSGGMMPSGSGNRGAMGGTMPGGR